MNLILTATSASFLVAGIIKKCSVLKILWVCSSLNHIGFKWINRVDKALSHSICVYSMLTCPRIISPSTVGFWVASTYAISVFKVFKLSYKPGIYGDLWHGTIHIVTFIGMVSYSYAQPRPTDWRMFGLLFGVFYPLV
jgi:hypothetical protein